jgi:hypothetical protein
MKEFLEYAKSKGVKSIDVDTLCLINDFLKEQESKQSSLNGVGCSLPDKDVFVYRLRDKIENMHKELDELNKNYLILGGQYAYKIINGLMKK